MNHYEIIPQLLSPGRGVEFKLVIKKGEKARFVWRAGDGRLNFDAHGNGGRKSVVYKKDEVWLVLAELHQKRCHTDTQE